MDGTTQWDTIYYQTSQEDFGNKSLEGVMNEPIFHSKMSHCFPI